MKAKLETFRARVEAETRQRYTDDWKRDQERGMDYQLSVHERSMVCRVKTGRKYANVDVGESGRYMVELSTGNIYGIKAYGVIHRGHAYGNLDTLDAFDWRPYQATRKHDKAA